MARPARMPRASSRRNRSTSCCTGASVGRRTSGAWPAGIHDRGTSVAEEPVQPQVRRPEPERRPGPGGQQVRGPPVRDRAGVLLAAATSPAPPRRAPGPRAGPASPGNTAAKPRNPAFSGPGGARVAARLIEPAADRRADHPPVVLGDERGVVRVVEVLLPLGDRLLVGAEPAPAEKVGARAWWPGSSRSSRARAGMSARDRAAHPDVRRGRRAAASVRRGRRACAGARRPAGTTHRPAPRRARGPARSAPCGPRRPSGRPPRRTGRGASSASSTASPADSTQTLRPQTAPGLGAPSR